MKSVVVKFVAVVVMLVLVCPVFAGYKMRNEAVSVVVSETRGGVSFSMTELGSRVKWVVDQPLFVWEFGDERGKVSSLESWKSVNVSRFRQPNGVNVAVVDLQRADMAAKCTLQLYPGRGPLRVSTGYKDLSAVKRSSPHESFGLDLTPGGRVEFLRIKKGTTNPDCLKLYRDQVRDGYSKVTPCSGSDDRDDEDFFPWFCFQSGGKCGAYLGWEFSGYAKFVVNGKPGAVSFSGGLEAEKFNKRGDVDLPSWFIGLYSGDEDSGANQIRRWWMKYRFPELNDNLYPRVHYNTWTALGTAVNAKNCLEQVEMAKKLGAELFHIDAGWYRGVDDWYPVEEKFPRGLGPIADAAHAAGMKFGLWTAPNHASLRMVGLHPDWVIADWIVQTPEVREASQPDAFAAAPMCWGDKPCEEYITGELERIVRDYKLDYLEHDQPIVMDCRQDVRHTHHLGGGQYELVKGYYRTYDTLRREFPGLILEDCMNGGHMMDYGLMQRFHVISLTDLYGALDNRRAVWGATYAIPSSYCEGYMQDSEDLPPHYMFRSFMMGLWSISADTTKWSTEKVKACREDVALYKDIRPILRDGDVYHVLPQADGKNWDGLEYYDPASGRGVLFVFRPDSGESVKTVKLRGLDRVAKYEVSFTDAGSKSIRTGAELMEKGIVVTLPERLGSEVVRVRRMQK